MIQVNLPSDIGDMIERHMASGEYNSPEAVIRAAMIVLEEETSEDGWDAEELKAAVRVGLDQLERGEYSVYDESTLHEAFEEARQIGIEMLKQTHPHKFKDGKLLSD